jgi:hypothetical protein
MPVPPRVRARARAGRARPRPLMQSMAAAAPPGASGRPRRPARPTVTDACRHIRHRRSHQGVRKGRAARPAHARVAGPPRPRRGPPPASATGVPPTHRTPPRRLPTPRAADPAGAGDSWARLRNANCGVLEASPRSVTRSRSTRSFHRPTANIRSLLVPVVPVASPASDACQRGG